MKVKTAMTVGCQAVRCSTPKAALHQTTRTRSTWCVASVVALLVAGAAAPAGAQTDLLGLVRAAPEGSWVQANRNSFSSVWTPSDLRVEWWLGGNDLRRIIGAWSSFAWDSRRSSLVIFGGGHANYAGNDVYTFNGRTLLWERSSLPSRVVPTDVGSGYVYGYPVDGAFNAPAAAHTYDNTVYVFQSDRVLTFGGAAWNTGGGYLKPDGQGGHVATGPYLFNPSLAHPDRVGGSTGSGMNPYTPGGRMWQNRDSLGAAPGVSKPFSFVEGFSDATVVGGKDVVYVGATANRYTTRLDLYRYTLNDLANPAFDTWAIVGRSWITIDDSHAAGALDPVRQWFVRTGGPSVPFAAWDLRQAGPDNPDRPIMPVDQSGQAPASFAGYGLAFDRKRGSFVAWGGGPDVWRLTPPAGSALTSTGWTLTRLPVAAGPVPAAQDASGGVLGKWQYAPELDVFIGLQDQDEGHVWVYKPVGWAEPRQPTIPGQPGRRAPLPSAPRR